MIPRSYPYQVALERQLRKRLIAIDRTGIKVTNRGQWMREKWKAGKKGYLKIHIAVDVKSKKILSMRNTYEHAHDSKALPGLVNGVMESGKK